MLWLLLPCAVGAATPLQNARWAQALLAPGTWSCVIRVENTGARSAYPAKVYALVFEQAGRLWFYTDLNGTQSLSLHSDRLAEEKSDLSPLLHGIDPGFSAWTSLPEDPAESPAAGDGPLPNGCFIESLALLQDQVRQGEPIKRARLLSCYVDTAGGRIGHTVLICETSRGLFLLDPASSPEPRRMPVEWADDAMALAQAELPGAKVAKARWIPVDLQTPVRLAAKGTGGNGRLVQRRGV
jgi:hypothetical protein